MAYSVSPCPGRPGYLFLSTPMRDLVISKADARALRESIDKELGTGTVRTGLPFDLPDWPSTQMAPEDAIAEIEDIIASIPFRDVIRLIDRVAKRQPDECLHLGLWSRIPRSLAPILAEIHAKDSERMA